MKFGENLYSLRKNAKMSQEKLAEEVGVSRQSVSKWENGESYPEMDNMLKLCTIFHCKLNDLVHEDMQDIDSLDESIKMSVVKLEKSKQKKLKVLSKIIYILAKIGKIGARIVAGCVIAGVIISTIILAKLNIESSKHITINSSATDVAEYVERDDGTIVVTGLDENDQLVAKELTEEESKDVKKIVGIVTKHSKGKTIALVICSGIAMVATMILTANALSNLEKLFKDIHDGDTPFTLENVHYMKTMTYLMIAVTIVAAIAEVFAGILTGTDISINMGFSLVNILFLYSIAYIFEYGYNLQKDSQGTIYGEDKE